LGNIIIEAECARDSLSFDFTADSDGSSKKVGSFSIERRINRTNGFDGDDWFDLEVYVNFSGLLCRVKHGDADYKWLFAAYKQAIETAEQIIETLTCKNEALTRKLFLEKDEINEKKAKEQEVALEQKRTDAELDFLSEHTQVDVKELISSVTVSEDEPDVLFLVAYDREAMKKQSISITIDGTGDRIMYRLNNKRISKKALIENFETNRAYQPLLQAI